MYRVSTDMLNTDMQYYMRRQEEGMLKIQSQTAAQNKILELRDDPLAASRAVRYESYLARLERFEKNALYASDHYNAAYAYMSEANDIMQRIRELGVTAANGIYAQDDLKNMASEVNELVKELVSISNAVGPDGTQLFAGDKAFTEPFRLIEGTVAGGGENMVVGVEYRGAGASRQTEMSERSHALLDLGGGEAFWAEKMQIYSTSDATDYRVNSSGAFFIDGVEISVTAGDTLPSIVAKINESPAPVKAYIDPQTRGLALEGTTAHLITAEDKVGPDGAVDSGAHVLRDLGIIRGNMENNAPNWNNTARVSGGSIFDMAIRMRDAMFRGDYDFIGGQGIGGMDRALDSFQARIAQVGSRQERAQFTWERLNREIPDVTENLARESAPDMMTAAMNLKKLEVAQQATMQMAAKLIPQTLLDFLR